MDRVFSEVRNEIIITNYNYKLEYGNQTKLNTVETKLEQMLPTFAA